jgi:hypothetical protein
MVNNRRDYLFTRWNYFQSNVKILNDVLVRKIKNLPSAFQPLSLQGFNQTIETNYRCPLLYEMCVFAVAARLAYCL